MKPQFDLLLNLIEWFILSYIYSTIKSHHRVLWCKTGIIISFHRPPNWDVPVIPIFLLPVSLRFIVSFLILSHYLHFSHLKLPFFLLLPSHFFSQLLKFFNLIIMELYLILNRSSVNLFSLEPHRWSAHIPPLIMLSINGAGLHKHGSQ